MGVERPLLVVRVAKGNVDQLLRDSGKNGLFFEPTAGEKIPVSIEWHSKGAEETSMDYLTRVIMARRNPVAQCFVAGSSAHAKSRRRPRW